MRDSSTRGSAAAVLGLALVALGIWSLLGGVLRPLFWPLRVAFEALGHFGWPLALIIIGAMLLTRERRRQEQAGTARPVAAGALTRSRSNRVVAGVLAGFANHFGWSPSTLRLGYALLTLLTGVWPGVIAYAFAAIFMPEEPFGYQAPYAPAAPTAPVPPNADTAPTAPVPPVGGAAVTAPVPPAPPQQ